MHATQIEILVRGQSQAWSLRDMPASDFAQLCMTMVLILRTILIQYSIFVMLLVRLSGEGKRT